MPPGRAGRSLAERQAARERYREQAIRQAALTGLTIRCRELQDNLDDPGHRMCRGEDRGNCGCLCRCHDIGISTKVLSRKDEQYV